MVAPHQFFLSLLWSNNGGVSGLSIPPDNLYLPHNLRHCCSSAWWVWHRSPRDMNPWLDRQTSTSAACQPGSLVYPTQHDIILGRGVLHASHPGNIRFYTIIDKYLPFYEAAESRSEKTKVVQLIYEEITSLGRFVKDDAASATCIVIETAAAKKKISHAIRFRRQGKKAISQAAKHNKSVSSSAVSVATSRLPSSLSIPINNNGQAKLVLPKRADQALSRPYRPPPFANDRKCSTNVDTECLFPPGELESVLLPPEDLAMATMVYEELLLGESLEEERNCDLTALNSTRKVIKDALEATNTDNDFLVASYRIP